MSNVMYVPNHLKNTNKSFYKTENDTLIYFINNDKFTTKDYEIKTELL